MTADLDTHSESIADESASTSADKRTDRGGRGMFGTLALLVFAVVAVVALLTQCTARVPDVVGLDRSAASAKLEKSGLQLGDVSEALSSSAKSGLVQEQIPASGVMLRTGATVDIILTRSNALLTVPNVGGRSSASAAVQLQQAGFQTEPAEQFSDVVPVGTAISQSPAAGSNAPRGSTVTVYYSIGPLASAQTSVTPSNTSGGFTSAQGSSGSGAADTPIFSTARAYPGATAWSSGGDIYVRLSPGAGTRRVTSGAAWDANPVVAPSGRYLVFTRASSASARPTAIGAVSFTSFETHLLTTPKVDLTDYDERWVGPPVFAPTPNSTTPNSDFIVYAHYFPLGKPVYSLNVAMAQLLVCKVPVDSTWVSWNMQFRPARVIKLSRSSLPGCVRVRQYDAGLRYDRNLNLVTGAYLR